MTTPLPPDPRGRVKSPGPGVDPAGVNAVLPSAHRPGDTLPPAQPGPVVPGQRLHGRYLNPVLAGGGVDHGDPFVLEHCGEYVLYHSGPSGVHAYRSRDLVAWEPVGPVLVPQGSAWAQTEFWAPEVVAQDGEFVMYVAATVPGGARWDSGRAAGSDGGDDTRRRQGVARAASPTGPFVLDPEPLFDHWVIDAHPFTDDDGTRWLFHNVCDATTAYHDGTVGTGNMVVRLGPDGRPVGDREPVCVPTQPWEGKDDGSRYWAEGAVVLARGGWYHQMYSGGFFGGAGYAVGVARAPLVRGPWTKDARSPLFVSGRRITGPGHHCVVVGPDGATPYAVYHGYDGDAFGRSVHVDRLYWAGDGPRIGGPDLPGHPGEGPLPVPAGPVRDPDVAHLHVRAWVTGGRARVLGVDLALPLRPALLTAGTDGGTVVVRRDGVVVARVDAGDVPADPAAPAVTCDGDVRHAVITSRLDDAHRYVLDAGASRSWAWGGSLPVTAEVAVRGRARIRLGDVVHVVDGPAGPDFRLVLLTAPGGADRLVVTADTDAEVADVVLAARTLSP